MFNDKEHVIESVKRAGDEILKASMYVCFLEDIFSALNLYPNINRYIDYGLICTGRGNINEIKEKFELLIESIGK